MIPQLCHLPGLLERDVPFGHFHRSVCPTPLGLVLIVICEPSHCHCTWTCLLVREVGLVMYTNEIKLNTHYQYHACSLHRNCLLNTPSPWGQGSHFLAMVGILLVA